MYSKGDKVTVTISKSDNHEMRELAIRFGDEVDGTVIGQTGRILMVETLNGLRLNPFIQDVYLISKAKKDTSGFVVKEMEW